MCIMSDSQNEKRRSFNMFERFSSRKADYREFACGWGAASINILITFPINKVIFRQMLHNVSPAAACRQLISEGLFTLYRGVLPPLLQKSVSASLMFGMYERCKRPLDNKNIHPLVSKILAALTAGTTESVLLPFERVQTLLQYEKYHGHFVNMKEAMIFLWKRHGFIEFYRGLSPVLFRNGPSSACFFILRDAGMATFPAPENVPGRMLNQFAIGAFIGAFCSTIFYPCNVLKVHMQRKIGGPFQNIFAAVKEIYIERGSVRAFFRGVHLNYTRSCLSWGIINVAYEGLKRLI